MFFAGKFYFCSALLLNLTTSENLTTQLHYLSPVPLQTFHYVTEIIIYLQVLPYAFDLYVQS